MGAATGRPDVTALLALTHLVLGEWRDIARLLTGPSASAVPPALVARAIATARAQGDEASARDLERAAPVGRRRRASRTAIRRSGDVAFRRAPQRSVIGARE